MSLPFSSSPSPFRSSRYQPSSQSHHEFTPPPSQQSSAPMRLRLTIRFSTSLPDLTLSTIPAPHLTSGITVISRIRKSLGPAKEARLKILLIAGGRLVPLREPLTKGLRLGDGFDGVSAWRDGDRGSSSGIVSGKGKSREFVAESAGNGNILNDANKHEFSNAEGRSKQEEQQTVPAQELIIHATFPNPETPLSEAELELERTEAESLDTSLRQRHQHRQQLQQQSTGKHPVYNHRTSSTISSSSQQIRPHQPPPARNTLRGFSRLQEIGIPADEITSLRAQFLSLLKANHTPSTTGELTPLDILALEDRWLDEEDIIPHSISNASPRSTDPNTIGTHNSSSNNTNAPIAFPSETATNSTYISDVLFGQVLGFFWPLGAVFWLCVLATGDLVGAGTGIGMGIEAGMDAGAAVGIGDGSGNDGGMNGGGVGRGTERGTGTGIRRSGFWRRDRNLAVFVGAGVNLMFGLLVWGMRSVS